MDIGEKIAYYRTLSGFTQVEVAKAIGITRSAVNSWEMGQSVPQIKHVVALAELFKISVDTLVIGDDARTLIDISGLDSEQQALVLQLVRCLGKSQT
ncbi:dNA-binding helix-turn-helix protein [Eubacterium sp. CAG:786]|nr:dNA-binding helix-turn-helix protein [Eubacterium sp. CAG:786]